MAYFFAVVASNDCETSLTPGHCSDPYDSTLDSFWTVDYFGYMTTFPNDQRRSSSSFVESASNSSRGL